MRRRERGGKFDNLSRCFWPVVRLSFICLFFAFFAPAEVKAKEEEAAAAVAGARASQLPHTIHTHTDTRDSTIRQLQQRNFSFIYGNFFCLSRQKIKY